MADLFAAPLTQWPDEQVARMLAATLTTRMWPPEYPFRAEVEHWTAQRAATEHSLLRYYLATGDTIARQVTDVPERFADRRVKSRWRDRRLQRLLIGVDRQIAR